MKKTLIALAVAASAAVSGSVMAADWTEGQPGNISIGGEVTPTSVKWLWKTGEGLSSFRNTADEIVNRKLNITVSKDELFLAAKMSDGVKGVFAGKGLIPKVTMASYDGSTITPTFTSDRTMTLPVKVKDSADNTDLGILSVHLSYGAAVASIFDGDTNSSAVSDIIAGSAGTVFEGLVNPGVETNKDIAFKWTGLTATDMADVVNKLMPGQHAATSSVGFHNWDDTSHSNYTSADKASYLAYGSGVPAGSTLVMDLNKDVAGRLEWAAPVAITVTYS
ncbi:TPA: F41 fimbrial protein [Escherichia coli]|uniref:F4 family fimbrial subunit n=1 Tax=Escherichia coli TaxID=562 RepID=UPI001658C584|nr:F41 fimbrial protein [Escherichia coli]MBC9658270.1 F41 fimbrial protein [Escherichia coli]MBC9686319.1 F41 fimbrial protein [Escherichia coli]MCB4695150.1 F41 fimbrial protein [Escherichia coli]MCJ7971694.1 F41 fimbrial protein [Escherichia coli]MCX3822673.1 F41 fimbrial protein [Escherichia coli]